MFRIRRIFDDSIKFMDDLNINYRTHPFTEDRIKVRVLLSETGFFSDEEINIAVEVIEEKLSLGDQSSYKLLFAESREALLGYTCFGLIPLTKASYDLYWIAVNPAYQGREIGQFLMQQTEVAIKELGGSAIYADTSSRKQYLPTRKFYTSCGFKKVAFFRDFYAPGDGKIVFIKKL